MTTENLIHLIFNRRSNDETNNYYSSRSSSGHLLYNKECISIGNNNIIWDRNLYRHFLFFPSFIWFMQNLKKRREQLLGHPFLVCNILLYDVFSEKKKTSSGSISLMIEDKPRTTQNDKIFRIEIKIFFTVFSQIWHTSGFLRENGYYRKWLKFNGLM